MPRPLHCTDPRRRRNRGAAQAQAPAALTTPYRDKLLRLAASCGRGARPRGAHARPQARRVAQSIRSRTPRARAAGQDELHHPGCPDLLGAVAAFSIGVVPRQISGASRSARVPHYIAAGTLEPGFGLSTRQWAERLRRAGLRCRHEEWIGSHDQVWWRQLLAALGWLLWA